MKQGSENAITLVQFRPAWGLPSGSPFCVKVDCYLRMAGLKFNVEYLDMPQKAPLGKLPFIRYQGRDIADSSLIQEALANAAPGAKALHKLKAADQARAVLLQRTLEDHFYFVMVYLRWQVEANWTLTRDAFFAHLPIGIRQIVPGLVRSSALKQLQLQGLGRHTEETIIVKGLQDLQAIESNAGWLSAKPSADPINGAVHGVATTVAVTPLTNEPR